jgi:hypothetical protein
VPPPVITTTNPFTPNRVAASIKDMLYQEGTGTKNFVSFGERQRLERYFIGTNGGTVRSNLSSDSDTLNEARFRDPPEVQACMF